MAFDLQSSSEMYLGGPELQISWKAKYKKEIVFTVRGVSIKKFSSEKICMNMIQVIVYNNKIKK